MENKIVTSNESIKLLDQSNNKSAIEENETKLGNQESTNNTQISSYVKDWLRNVDFDDTNSEISQSAHSTAGTSDLCDSDAFERVDDINVACENSLLSSNINFVNNINLSYDDDNTSKNVVIQNSKNVVIGNITIVKGPVKHVNFSGNVKSAEKLNSEEKDEYNSETPFIGNIRRRLGGIMHIVDRKCWLAQDPLLPYDYINKPVDFVIISHTATTSATTQSENSFLVRNIQSFHVEAPLKWNDIAYNFLIGSDGLVYQGRGWNVVGAHTRGYNIKSVGLSFIGCFMKELPPAESLHACKQLIETGIKLEFITKDYKLLGHCQCSVTESPGKCLFDEIKTWEHYYEF